MDFSVKKRWKSKSIVNLILSILVAVIAVARFLRADYYSVFLCLITLLLFNIPHFVNKRLNVELPAELWSAPCQVDRRNNKNV